MYIDTNDHTPQSFHGVKSAQCCPSCLTRVQLLVLQPSPRSRRVNRETLLPEAPRWNLWTRCPFRYVSVVRTVSPTTYSSIRRHSFGLLELQRARISQSPRQPRPATFSPKPSHRPGRLRVQVCPDSISVHSPEGPPPFRPTRKDTFRVNQKTHCPKVPHLNQLSLQ